MNNSKRGIESRRKSVASLLAQAATEEEIAQKLNVDQSTISRDITHLKVQSRQFVYDLAKSDLAFSYKLCIDGVEEVKRKAWFMFNNELQNPKDKLLALKIIAEANESIFSLFGQGPQVLNLRSLQERVEKIEGSASGSGYRQAI
jgi:transcriptional antiterminator